MGYDHAKFSNDYDLLVPIVAELSKDEIVKTLCVWANNGNIDVNFISPHPFTVRDSRIRDLTIWAIDTVWNWTEGLRVLTKRPLDNSATHIQVQLDVVKMMDRAKMYGSNRSKERKRFVEDMEKLGDIKAKIFRTDTESVGSNEVMSSTMWFYSNFKVIGEYERVEFHVNKRYAQLLMDGKVADLGAFIEFDNNEYLFMRWMSIHKSIEGKGHNQHYHTYLDLKTIGEVVYGDEDYLIQRTTQGVTNRKNFKRMLIKLNRGNVIPPYDIILNKGYAKINEKKLLSQTKAYNKRIKNGKHSN